MAQQAAERSACSRTAAGELAGCQGRRRGVNRHQPWPSTFQRGDLPTPVKTRDVLEELQDLSAPFLTWKNREIQISPAEEIGFVCL